MFKTVIIGPQATFDINALRAYLNQPGSGVRSKALAKKIVKNIRQLRSTSDSYPEDQYWPENKQMVIDSTYVVSFKIDGNNVIVKRVYGPGQNRP